jgi:hypothetical protein
MIDTKTYTFAGVSRRNGIMKARFANDATRVKVLAKTGSKDIDIIELPRAMTKLEAIETLLKADFDRGNKEVRAALEAALDSRAESPVKAAKPTKTAKAPTKTAKPTKATKAPAKPSMDSIKAKAAAAKAKAAAAKAKAEAEVPEQSLTEAKAAVAAELTDEDAPF